MKERKRLVLLDTHAILHRGYHALPDFASKKGEPTGALYGLVSMLLKIISDFKPDYIIAAGDLPDPTHRHLAFEKYKAQRKETDDALVAQIKRMPDVLKAFGIPLYEAPGFEADDVIGTVAKELKKKDIDVIVASGDMDMLQLVDDSRVRVFTFKKGLSDTILYDEEAVKTRFGFGPELIPDYKGLRGDPSDNIPGVKGIGEKTASALIQQFGTVEQIYKVLKKDESELAKAGVKAGMLEKLKSQQQEAKFSKELATIHTGAPIKFKLPEKEWGESVSEKEVLDMFAEFDFRSLIPRVKKLLGASSTGEDRSESATPSKRSSGLPAAAEVSGSGARPFSQEGGLFADTVPAAEFADAALMVSVLDGTISEPTLEDIFRMGNSEDFEQAKKNLLAEIKKEKADFVYEKIEKPLSPVLRTMEARGVLVDKKFLAQLSKDYHVELKEIAARIYKAAGGEFNINSPKQLGDILFDKLGLAAKNQKKTAGGQRSTRESELEKLRDQHPIIADILKHRELQKLLSTYIDSIPTLLDSDNRLHTSYVQIGAGTGRMASKNPNLQNIPIKSELGRAIRHGFIASPGMKLVSFDYSQIELRVAAFLSKDPTLTEIFKEGRDVHSEVAARVFHIRPEDVNYEQRRRAKVINFGIIYGMGVNALKDALGTSRGEAQEFYDQYFAAFPRLSAYLDEVVADATRRGFTETYFGRKRYFEAIKSPIPYIRAAAERAALNAPFQGTAADLLKLAMVNIGEWQEKEAKGDVHMLLQVHDELVFEIKEERIDSCAKKIKELMEGVLSEKENRGVPFVAEGKAGVNWGDMEKLRV
ncbi:MAG TPA: DNA polymerase [Candidatus Paceibacterota bacterium]|nr:DNA polymerase [Candidatus Paceibacterota bacterium]